MDRTILGVLLAAVLVVAPLTPGGPGPAGAGPTPVAVSTGTGTDRYEYYRYGAGVDHLLLAEFRRSRVAVADTGSYGCFSGRRTSTRTWKGYVKSGDGFDAGSITGAARVRRGADGSVLIWGDGSRTIRASRTSTAEAARILRGWYWNGTPRQVARHCRGPRASARVKAVEGASPLHVSVSPASSAFDWRLTVQRRTASGSWRTYTTGTTATTSDEVLGIRSTRTFALPKGTYRVRVHGVRGYPGSMSRPASLTR